jgi:hypothetical protein
MLRLSRTQMKYLTAEMLMTTRTDRNYEYFIFKHHLKQVEKAHNAVVRAQDIFIGLFQWFRTVLMSH